MNYLCPVITDPHSRLVLSAPSSHRKLEGTFSRSMVKMPGFVSLVIYILFISYQATIGAGQLCPRQCVCTKDTLVDVGAWVIQSIEDVQPLQITNNTVMYYKQRSGVQIGLDPSWFVPSNFTDFDSQSLAHNIMCNVNEEFDLDVALMMFTRLNMRPLAVTMVCRNQARGPVVWNAPGLSNTITSLRVMSCDILPLQKQRTLPMGPSIIEFTNVNSEFLQAFEFPSSGVKFLKMDSNEARVLSDGITAGLFPDLYWLVLKNNNFGPLPCTWFSSMTSLQGLHLLDNKNFDFTDCSCGFKNLKVALVQNNGLTNLNMFNCSGKASVIMAGNNEITMLDEAQLNGLGQLKILDLGYNNIDQIEPGSFAQLKSIQLINLRYNRLSNYELPQTPPVKETLTVVDLGKNLFRYLPFYRSRHSGIPESVRVLLDGNPFVCNCSMVTSCELREHGAHDISMIDKRMTAGDFVFVGLDTLKCSGPESVKDVALIKVNGSSSCHVTQDCPESCVCKYHRISGVTEINCTGADIYELPKELPPGSLVLHFQRNRIRLVTQRRYFGRVEEIDLSYNRIVDVAAELFHHPIKINLRRNSIRTLPPEAQSSPYGPPSQIDLRNNPWECTCETVWMSRWIKGLGSRIVNPKQIECANGRVKRVAVVEVKSLKEMNGCSILSIHFFIAAIVGGVAVIVFLAMIIICIRTRYVRTQTVYKRLVKRGRTLTSAGTPPVRIIIACAGEDFVWAEKLAFKLQEHDPPYSPWLVRSDESDVDAKYVFKSWQTTCDVLLLVMSPALSRGIDSLDGLRESLTTNAENQGNLVVINRSESSVSQLDPALADILSTRPQLSTTDSLFFRLLVCFIERARPHSLGEGGGKKSLPAACCLCCYTEQEKEKMVLTDFDTQSKTGESIGVDNTATC